MNTINKKQFNVMLDDELIKKLQELNKTKYDNQLKLTSLIKIILNLHLV
jgi:hypothetical protein